MIRLISLTFLTVCMAVPAMAQQAECDARSAWRGDQVQYYVPKAMACVDRPNEGFWYDALIEEDIFDRVNAVRVAAGLPQLSFRPELLAPARVHSFDMAQEGFFAHRGVDGRSPFQRISALDRTLVQSEARENLASVSGDFDYTQVGSLLHNLLMDSDGHRANILAPNLTHMAVGLVRTEKGAWVTQVFVKQDGTLDTPLALVRSASEPLVIGAQLSTWEFADTVLQATKGTEYKPSPVELAPTGDLQLLVLGMRMTDERTRQNIKLNGPSVSVVH